MSYYVEPNNWTSKIPSSITSDRGTFLFNVNLDLGDPAVNCPKDFTASYKCGNNDSPLKTLRIAKPADGKNAVFDCSKEWKACAMIHFWLIDTGHLRLHNAETGKLLWTNETDTSITIPASIPVDAFKATNGKNGRNYLAAGEFLNVGEWIGSPNGKYRLLMDTDKQLKVVYNKLGCDRETGPDANVASSVYVVTPNPYRSNLGKLGYVDHDGLLQLYPDTMTTFTSQYTDVGAYNVAGGNIGALVTANVADANACQDLCSSHNAGGGGADAAATATSTNSDKCAGIVFDKVNKTCQLKDRSIFATGKRIINNNYEYYLRTKGITGNDISCPSSVSDFEVATTGEWNTMTLGSGMTPSTKCGLANFTADERTQSNAKDAILKSNANTIKPKIDTLVTKNTTLQEKLQGVKTKLSNMLNELINSRNDPADWSGEQLTQLEAMNEDRDLNMLSQNYKHIMWSILAIIVIIGTIALTKKAIGSAASAASSGAASSGAASSGAASSASPAKA